MFALNSMERKCENNSIGFEINRETNYIMYTFVIRHLFVIRM